MPRLLDLGRAILLMAILAVAACGGTSDTDAARDAWRKASVAAASGDATGFCNLVSERGRQLITSRTDLSCEDSMRMLGGLLGSADRTAIRNARILDVDVRDGRAIVTYANPPALAKLGFTGRTVLEKAGDRWLLSGL